jgi:hypothetical protein
MITSHITSCGRLLLALAIPEDGFIVNIRLSILRLVHPGYIRIRARTLIELNDSDIDEEEGEGEEDEEDEIQEDWRIVPPVTRLVCFVETSTTGELG